MKYQEVVQKINQILQQYDEVTVRQLFYRLVSPPYQYMANTNSMYVSFDKMLTRAREEGDINSGKIVDRTRRVIPPPETWDTSTDFMDDLRYRLEGYERHYDMDRWQNQDYRLWIFVEKDALAEIIAEVAKPYQVTVVPGRGFNSYTQLQQIANELVQEVNKSRIVLYFGDFDPSGLAIDQSIETRLADYSGVSFTFDRIALTTSDITSIPANPTKVTDTRAKDYIARYGNQCWELDALPPNILKSKVRTAIETYIDGNKWAQTEQTVKAERAAIKVALEQEMGIG